ncbi:type II toxin-antitoxin system CcdA family antitoxin [Rhodoplanes sp. TEM]|uniref:Type II toxin-antitoxin system CcdA family antitoxin n=2 Tax=Rhodoplanes TaxID=29407 RepID=A0ABT5J7R0_RHOTP|nr:type II toxin-antitoxin system CcdA family antitoxin [Rhodoplanes tepidamans]MDC7785621.1 type II toxin-antitoxin system CcdA family antitoxin [Rhodoplanes tepidamans]MDC7985722.1 type II toxin-antitoxin system CcdA family antitoxin [Rhodoplanes sp. TEM]MDQ0354813.1 antitoxin CcdA [Rhodoplanes tepidamans]
MKRSVNLSVDAVLLDEAEALNIDLSQTLEAGLRRAVAEAKAARWREDNDAAIRSANAWVEANGLPLETYRQF